MGNVFSKLPAFAADYSGAASVFYDLNGITITYDAGSCAGCYWILEEPRLFNETKNIFSANLREKDVVLGADRKFKAQVRETYDKLGGECVSIFGTPVPTVIGTDFKGLAREIEKDLGIPAFGIDTNGLEFYDAGQRKSYESLLNYVIKNQGENLTDVNIIGATPIDMWDLNQIQDMIRFLKEAGAKTPSVWGANGKLKEIAGAAGAKLNIAVSVSAIPIVKKMEEMDAKLILESDLTDLLRSRTAYDVIIGDPLYFSLLPYSPEQIVSLPHIAVSSRAFWNKSPNCFGEKGSLYFEQILMK